MKSRRAGMGNLGPAHTYFQTLLDNLTQAQEDGLSLQQAKDKFPLEKEPAAMRRYFFQPEHVSEIHLKNIETIWALLQQGGSSDSQEHSS